MIVIVIPYKLLLLFVELLFRLQVNIVFFQFSNDYRKSFIKVFILLQHHRHDLIHDFVRILLQRSFCRFAK
ncbi:hypothetical protein D3C72_2482710 [compost metagenome]